MLDLRRVLPQIQAFAADRSERAPEARAAGESAHGALVDCAAQWETTADRVEAARTSWLLATLLESPTPGRPVPACPVRYLALATDGSQIAPDRHQFAFCYLLNIGTVALRYGDPPMARLASTPTLAYRDEDLYEDSGGDRHDLTPRVLALRRQTAEWQAAGSLIEEYVRPGEPAVTLIDGSLILWPLEAEPTSRQERVVGQFMELLDGARARRAPLVGYISTPRSRDVINALRVHRCPYPSASCERNCAAHPGPMRSGAPCSGFEAVTDADLFQRVLSPGERSAVFGSRSKILSLYHTDHAIRFFYLRTEHEVARVEVPRWVAEDAALLTFVHAAVADQVVKGLGYPRALTEAHERAIVRAADREAFTMLLRRAFVRGHVPAAVTRKALSKLTRSV